MHVERCRQGSDYSVLQKTSFHAAFSSNSSDFERYWSTNSLERKHKSVIKQNRNGLNRNARTLWNEASTSRISSKSQLFRLSSGVKARICKESRNQLYNKTTINEIWMHWPCGSRTTRRISSPVMRKRGVNGGVASICLFKKIFILKKLPSPSHYACRPIVLRHKAITFIWY